MTLAIWLETALAADCIARPRAATSETPLSKDKAPAAYNAEYSPRLKPATATTWLDTSGRCS
jgi:hypothetical protein